VVVVVVVGVVVLVVVVVVVGVVVVVVGVVVVVVSVVLVVVVGVVVVVVGGVGGCCRWRWCCRRGCGDIVVGVVMMVVVGLVLVDGVSEGVHDVVGEVDVADRRTFTARLELHRVLLTRRRLRWLVQTRPTRVFFGAGRRGGGGSRLRIHELSLSDDHRPTTRG
jgi:hypothetical protein